MGPVGHYSVTGASCLPAALVFPFPRLVSCICLFASVHISEAEPLDALQHIQYKVISVRAVRFLPRLKTPKPIIHLLYLNFTRAHPRLVRSHVGGREDALSTLAPQRANTAGRSEQTRRRGCLSSALRTITLAPLDGLTGGC